MKSYYLKHAEMKNIPNVLALPLLNMDLVSVIVTLHRHDSMLDTNEMIMIAMTVLGSKTNRTSRSANQHTIIVKTNKAEPRHYYDAMPTEGSTREVVNLRQTNNCLTTKDNTIDYD